MGKIIAGVLLLVFCSKGFGFICRNGQVIDNSLFCNEEIDCLDGSDEIYTNASRSQYNLTEFGCQPSYSNKTCLLARDFLCNSSISCVGVSPCDVGCPDYYQCLGSKKCSKRRTVCDQVYRNGCPSSDNEWTNGIGFRCVRNGNFCMIPQQLLWDNIQDCDDAADICYVSNVILPASSSDLRRFPNVSFLDKKCFMCLDGAMIIPRHKVCDGVIDCSDLSDECLCAKQNASICDYVVPIFSKSLSPNPNCTSGTVVCASDPNTCLARNKVCDGEVDCQNNTDESFSYCRGTLPCAKGEVSDAGTLCRCSKFMSSMSTMGILCNGEQECPLGARMSWSSSPGYPQTECQAKCPPDAPKFGCTYFGFQGVGEPLFLFQCEVYVNKTYNLTKIVLMDGTLWCNGLVDCPVSGMDEIDCPNRFRCPAGKHVSIPKYKICNGYPECDNGEDETKELCPKRFFCPSLNGKKVSIESKFVCDFNINCDDASDELNCTTDGRWYCEGTDPYYVAKHKIINGINDCGDWSDECSPKLKTQANVLSSKYELIANPVLRGIVWIMAILALAGNTIVIIEESKTIKSLFQRHSAASLRINHMLILNLAVADMLMGIYLLMLGIVGIIYSGIFCSKSMEWLGSNACVCMGVLVVLSSETSVLTMLLLTSSRLYAVLNPFQASSHPKTQTAVMLIALTWAVSMVLAFIPLGSKFQETFSDRAFIINNTYFSKSVVTFDEAKQFTDKLFTFYPGLHNASQATYDEFQQAGSWIDLQNFFDTYSPSAAVFLNVSNVYGYYSASSVCIPEFFVTTQDRAWRFSLTISIVNFLVFIYVTCAYTMVFFKAGKSSKGSKGEKGLTEIQGKILRLVMTDFCCWVPISIMVFINFSGVQINSISYAVSAIILLPINSALNPILYSSSFDRLIAKCRKKRDRSLSITSSTQATKL